MKKFKYLFLFIIGGTIYSVLEILFRGYTHESMFILSGICFLLMGSLNEVFSWKTPLWKQVLFGGICTTTLEFITGCIINLWLGLNVWNYTYLDLLGQISLPFFFMWCGLSLVGIILDDYLRYWFFGESKPKYVIF